MQTMYKTGRGCVSKPRTNFQVDLSSGRRERLEHMFAESDKRRQEHEAWLKTPEGIEATRILAEMQAKRLQEAMHRREEAAKREVWGTNYDRIRAEGEKAVGVVLSGEGQVHTDEWEGKPVAFVVRYFGGDYPATPKYFLDSRTRTKRGLKCLLNKASMDEMNKRYSVDLEAGFISNVKVKSVRIIGYSKSGLSARCEVVEW